MNPSSETLEILALANGVWILDATHVGRTTVRSQPFDAIELDLAATWPPANVVLAQSRSWRRLDDETLLGALKRIKTPILSLA
jgi:hypothetical protein